VVADNEFTLSDGKLHLNHSNEAMQELLIQQLWWLMYRDSLEQTE